MPPDPQTLFHRATSHHQAGDLARAERAYRQALTRDPNHADSLHGLGVLAHQQGRPDLAIGYIGKALQLNPRQPHYLINLGRALHAQNHTEEARAAFRSAVLLSPDDPIAHFNLATALADLGRSQEAAESYRTALRLNPSFPEACANLGLLLHKSGNLPEAESCFRSLAALRPTDAAAHGLHAIVLRQLHRIPESEPRLREAVRLDPGNPEFLHLLGATLIDLDRPAEAEPPLRAALQLNPDHIDARNNLGLALHNTGRPEAALPEIRHALHLQPDNANILNNLATILRDLGHPDEAECTWRDAIARDPHNPSAHFNLGTALLAKGDFAAGWPEFEWRDRVPGARPRDFPQPRWTGEPLGDRVLLIHAEQGFGDTIQFCRYVPLAARHARIVLEVPQPLIRLLGTLAGVEHLIPLPLAGGERIIPPPLAGGGKGEGPTQSLPSKPIIPFSAHCPLLSLPHLFGTTLDTIPAEVPYLIPPPLAGGGKREGSKPDTLFTAPDDPSWTDRIANLPGRPIGLCWAGSRAYSQDRWRSLPAEALALLAAIPGLSFVSLQKDLSEPAAAGLHLHDWTEHLTDFAETAALISRLDLVISVDTAVAHLAGALGKPVWLLNRFEPDWRWLRDRNDSPWYPTLRQFRQPAPGDWSSVVQQVAHELARWHPGPALG